MSRGFGKCLNVQSTKVFICDFNDYFDLCDLNVIFLLINFL